MVKRRQPDHVTTQELTFPFNGVEEIRGYLQQRFGTCADAVNVRAFDPATGRARGGRRQGMEKFLAAQPVGDFPIQHMAMLVTTDVSAPATSIGHNGYALASGSGFGVADSTGASVFTAGSDTGYAMSCQCWDDDGNVYTTMTKTGVDPALTSIYKHSAAGTLATNFPVTTITVTTGSLRAVCGMVVIGDHLYFACTQGGVSRIHRIHKTTGAVTMNWRTSTSIATMVFSTSAVSCLGKVGTLLGVVCRASSNSQCFKIFDTTKSVAPISTALGGTGGAQRATCVSDGLAFFYIIGDTTTSIVKKIGIGGIIEWSSTIFDASGIQGLCYDFSLGYLVGVTTATPSLRRFSLTAGTSVETADPNSVTSYNWIGSDTNGFFTLYRNALGADDTVGINSTYTVVWGPTTRANTTHSGAAVNRGLEKAPANNGTAEIRLLSWSSGIMSRFDEDGADLISGGAVFDAQDAAHIATAQSGNDLYIADGATYKKYKSLTNSIVAWTPSAGSLPVDSLSLPGRLLANWLDCMMIAGLPNDPRTLFASAIGDPTDYDYDPAIDDPGQAFSLGLKDVITCLIAHKSDILVIGCDHQIWQLTGHPGVGGQLVVVSEIIGMAWGMPYAIDPNGQIYFFGTAGGIWKMQPSTAPVPVSQQIERRLDAVNLDTCRIRMAWDVRNHGLGVWITPHDTTQDGINFFYEDRTNAWQPEFYTKKDHCPMSVLVFDGLSLEDRTILLGCRDGYIRKLSTASKDDGQNIEWSVTIGPIKTWVLDQLTLHNLQATLAADSDTVTWGILVGDTAEEALDSDAVTTGTWEAGRNPVSYIRRAAKVHYVELSGTGDFGIEKIVAEYSLGGDSMRRFL